jgi:integrase
MSVHTTPKGVHFAIWYEGSGSSRKQRKKVFGTGESALVAAHAFDSDKKRGKGKLTDPAAINVGSLCQEYHSRQDVAASTKLNHFYKFTASLIPALGAIPVDPLSTRDLDLYVKRRIDSGIKRATIASEIGLLKAVYAWGQRQEPPLVHRNAVASYRVKTSNEEQSIPMPPTLDEIRRILAHAEPRLARAIKIHWHSGLRPGGELFRLNWEDIDFLHNEMRVQSAHKGGPAIRLVPIHDDLKADMIAWLDQDRKRVGEGNVWGLPVVNYNGRGVYSLKRSWARAKALAHISRKLRLYDLRQAFASATLRAGGDLKSVSEVLGHSRLDTTLRVYQHVTREQHHEIVGLMPSIDDLGNMGNIIKITKGKRRYK